MTLESGSRLGHYEIVEPLGKGGMGEVYRARDTKLNRAVALKILPEAFANDPQRMGRFQREAQVLASLSHPYIGAIYGLEDSTDTKALVLEIIEGPTLAERIRQGPIAVEEALKIALQIAEALEAAHEKGIIHRDLKPANVKITPGGAVKVLDFGLAKAMEEDSQESSDMTASPTLSLAATKAGVILGTAAYMSPEQARGKPVDRRSDIFAFGALLFEMLTGKRAFVGDDISLTLAKVLERDPVWENLSEGVSPAIRRLLSRCLSKDINLRLQAIGEARITIREYLANPDTDTPEPTTQMTAAVASWQQPRIIAGIVVAAVLATTAATWFLKPIPERQLSRMLVTAEQLQERPAPPVLSPDGNKLVYGAGGRLWLRYLDRFKAEPLTDSENAQWPFFSPDSAFMAYGQDNKLRKVNLSTGAKTTLCDLPGAMIGGTWSEDGSIVFGSRNGLYEVSDQGGEPNLMLEPDQQKGEEGSILPHYLPHGEGLVFTVLHIGDDYIDMYAGGERTTLIKQDRASFAIGTYSNSGHLLYQRRGGSNVGLWAVPFSLSSLEITGQPFLIDPTGSSPAVSDDGRLGYWRGTSGNQQELVWVDRGGRVESTIGQPQGGMDDPSLSPDGNWVAVTSDEEGIEDVWLHDVRRGTKRRLTILEHDGSSPAWTASGDRVAFETTGASGPEIWIRPADSSTGAVKLIKGLRPHFSADGRYMVFQRRSPETGNDLWYLELGKEDEPTPFLVTEQNELHSRLSADGRWIAYVSDFSGQDEIYVKRFPSGDGIWQLSTNGGNYPRWSSDGDELFYLEGRNLMVVPVKGSNSLDHGTPAKLFTLLAAPRREYDVTDGGDRFILPRLAGSDDTPPSIAIVTNWFAEFKDRK